MFYEIIPMNSLVMLQYQQKLLYANIKSVWNQIKAFVHGGIYT